MRESRNIPNAKPISQKKGNEKGFAILESITFLMAFIIFTVYVIDLFTAIHTGVREGELAGLQTGDIDFNGKYLVVRRSIADHFIDDHPP